MPKQVNAPQDASVKSNAEIATIAAADNKKKFLDGTGNWSQPTVETLDIGTVGSQNTPVYFDQGVPKVAVEANNLVAVEIGDDGCLYAVYASDEEHPKLTLENGVLYAELDGTRANLGTIVTAITNAEIDAMFNS